MTTELSFTDVTLTFPDGKDRVTCEQCVLYLETWGTHLHYWAIWLGKIVPVGARRNTHHARQWIHHAGRHRACSFEWKASRGV